ncbi:MAG: hypothetical protein NTX40_00175 [Planctomycetota bacterium]|nr:hypothetical protein [Planctomycetota bacterium]
MKLPILGLAAFVLVWTAALVPAQDMPQDAPPPVDVPTKETPPEAPAEAPEQPPPVAAEESPSPTVPVQGGEEELVQLTFPENLELKILVDYVTTRLGINLLYDEGLLKRRITISAPAKVPKESLFGLLQSVLRMSGLLIVDGDQPGWKEIVPAQNLVTVTEGFEEDPRRLADAEATRAMTQVFTLRNVAPSAVEPVIKPFLGTPGGNSFAVPDRSLLFVTDYADNLRRVAEMIRLFDQPGPKAQVHFVAVKHWDAAELAQRVTALLRERDRVTGREGKAPPRPLSLTHEPRTNQVILVATEGAEAEALDLLEALDVPTDIQTRTYYFASASPERIDRLAREFAGPDAARTRYRSILDAQSGLLIVTASPEVHAWVESLKADLDVAAAAELSPVRFYKLVNTTAAEVLATIRALESQEGGIARLAVETLGPPVEGAAAKPVAEPFTGPNRPPPAPGEELPKPPSYKEPEKEPEKASPAPDKDKGAEKASPSPDAARPLTRVQTKDAVVTADPNTNTIIVVAPPPVQRVYERLIAMLDKRRPQVLIEITLVTLDVSDNLSFGIEISGANERDDWRWLSFSSFGLSAVDLATGALALQPGTGFNGIVIDPHTVDVVLRALATNGHARVLSAPKILVNDNATGTLSSVAESPFTSVNASETVATTSFAGYASAGTTVTVTPHISEGEHLQLNYSITLNSFTGAGAAGIPPPRQTDSITSLVTVPSGHAIIVGGLKRRDTSETVSKIPLLGDIPGLEYLFSSRTQSDAETTFFVFIRPVILRDDRFEDLKYLSERDLRLAELPAEYPASEPMLVR